VGRGRQLRGGGRGEHPGGDPGHAAAGGDPGDALSYGWLARPPADLWAAGGGQPHLTWIFVAPGHAGRGVGTALLAAAAAVLRRRGGAGLWSTFLAGNESSALWHWRTGFELLPHPLSRRQRSRELSPPGLEPQRA
jgi:GNAT superfamily N-acetyltransferase